MRLTCSLRGGQLRLQRIDPVLELPYRRFQGIANGGRHLPFGEARRDVLRAVPVEGGDVEHDDTLDPRAVLGILDALQDEADLIL